MGLESVIQPIDMAIKSIDPVSSRSVSGSQAATGEAGFGEILSQQIDSVVDLQNSAEQMQRGFLAGDDVSLSEVVMAVQKADLALTFVVEFRNKIVEAYQEISRTQL